MRTQSPLPSEAVWPPSLPASLAENIMKSIDEEALCTLLYLVEAEPSPALWCTQSIRALTPAQGPLHTLWVTVFLSPCLLNSQVL